MLDFGEEVPEDWLPAPDYSEPSTGVIPKDVPKPVKNGAPVHMNCSTTHDDTHIYASVNKRTSPVTIVKAEVHTPPPSHPVPPHLENRM